MATSSRSIRSPRVASSRQLRLVQRQPRARGERTPRRAVEHRVGRDGAARTGRHGAHRAVRGGGSRSRGSPARVGRGPRTAAERRPSRARASRVGVCRPVRGCSTASSATSPPRRCRTRGSRPRARSTSRSATRPGPIPARPRAGGGSGDRRRRPGRRRAAGGVRACPPPWSGSRSARRGRRPPPAPPGSRSRSCRCSWPSTRSSCCSRPASASTSSGADDPELPRYQRVAATAFAHPGGARDVGDVPLDTSPEAARPHRGAARADRLRPHRDDGGRRERRAGRGRLAPAGRHRRHRGQRGRRRGHAAAPARPRARRRPDLGAGRARHARPRTWSSWPPGTTTSPGSTSGSASPGWRPPPSPSRRPLSD